jgi:hemolysin D
MSTGNLATGGVVVTTAKAAATRHPFIELMGRYRAVLKSAWSARHQMAGPSRLADEAAFLPAALSLQETPVHPAPRRVSMALCALFLIALAWAFLGKIDIVAVAEGRIVVSERTKVLQPLETSVVKRLFVKEGESVEAGQVLVELDATNAMADGASVQEQLASAVSEERRTTALIEALRTQRPPSLQEGSQGAAAPDAVARLQAEWGDINAKLAKFHAEQARRQAEIATVASAIDKLEATLPIMRQREADIARLSDQGFMSSHARQDRARERMEQELDLATQRARLAEGRAAQAEALNAMQSYLAETRRVLGERRADAALKHQQLSQEQSKAELRSRLTQLRAPVSGTVQQVAIHTEGGVVTPAQALMVIVPKGAEVTAEVVIDNKDIGFVHRGQPVTVKLETFPFTRYGTIDAEVKSVTADAVNDEKRGAIFPATLTLAQSGIQVDDKRIALSPGMNVVAEIKTGRRRVIDYLFSPVRKSLDESLKER